MMGTTHMACGGMFSAAALIAFQIKDPATALVGFSFGVLGSLVPDIDHPQATLARKNLLLGALSRICAAFSSHRRFWHTPVAWVAISVGMCALLMFLDGIFGTIVRNLLISAGNESGLEFFNILGEANMRHYIIWACVFLLVGEISHGVADSFNPEGVPWLFPLRPLDKKYHVPVISVTTHTIFESLYSGIFTFLMIVLCYIYMTHTISVLPDFMPKLLGAMAGQ